MIVGDAQPGDRIALVATVVENLADREDGPIVRVEVLDDMGGSYRYAINPMVELYDWTPHTSFPEGVTVVDTKGERWLSKDGLLWAADKNGDLSGYFRDVLSLQRQFGPLKIATTP